MVGPATAPVTGLLSSLLGAVPIVAELSGSPSSERDAGVLGCVVGTVIGPQCCEEILRVPTRVGSQMTAAGIRRLGAALVTLLLTVLMLWVSAPGAQAHSDLVQAGPADGARVDKLPAQGALRFDEDFPAADLVVRAAGKVLPGRAGAGPPGLVHLRPARGRAGHERGRELAGHRLP